MFETLGGGPWTLGRLRDEMDSLFTNVFEGNWPYAAPGLATAGSFPAMNVWETDQAFGVELEVPGLKLEDIELTAVGNELTVKGSRNNGEPKEDNLYHRRERLTGNFSRSIRLPVDFDAGKVEATVKDGVLTVTLPKAEAVKPRKIAVKSS